MGSRGRPAKASSPDVKRPPKGPINDHDWKGIAMRQSVIRQCLGPGVVIIMAVLTLSAQAAGSYDGNWTGTLVSYSNLQAASCRGTVTAKIENNSVTGLMQSSTVSRHIVGKISDTGLFTGKADQYTLSGKFNASLFTGTFIGLSECGLEQIFMTRS
jgi:hypothetical protein